MCKKKKEQVANKQIAVFLWPFGNPLAPTLSWKWMGEFICPMTGILLGVKGTSARTMGIN